MTNAWTVWGLLLSLAAPSFSYKISTLDAMEVCNETIYLGAGLNSAAILTLTSKSYYDYTPMHCYIRFVASMHPWSGLTGVLEDIDLRRFDDPSRHHHPENDCVDYIIVRDQTDLPQGRQCGSWSVGVRDELSPLGPKRALVGYCPTHSTASSSGSQRCGVSTEIHVEVSVGERDNLPLWSNVKWERHRGFRLVVTAYGHSYGESKCADGLRSCGLIDHQKEMCVHESLWCDHHINCGQPHNLDEMSCFNSYVTMEGLVPVMVGPWVGAALLLLLLVAGVVYWRHARPPAPRDPRPPQELNSYAESYEVSSTLSSAHHMAIQVRVVCNSGHGMVGNGATHLTTTQLPPPHSLHRWPGSSTATMDLPPSYESLFPHGPPSPRSCMAATPATPASAASLDITATTTSLLSLGSSTGAASPGHNYPPAAASATQTSNIVIPLSAICSSTHTPSISTTSTTVTTAPSSNHSNTTTITEAGSTSTTLPVASSSASVAQVNAPSVEFTPLVQPEDSAISPSSLCGDPLLHCSTTHHTPCPPPPP